MSRDRRVPHVVPALPSGASPLSEPVWRHTLLVAAGSVGACLLFQAARAVTGIAGGIAIGVALVPALAAWLAAVRLLLLDGRWRRFWILWLTAGIAFIPTTGGGDSGWGVATGFAAVFLLFRRYRPYRHLTSARRAWVFVWGLVALGCVVIGWTFTGAVGTTGSVSAGANLPRALLRYLLGCLQLFWLLTEWRLILGMRLHFMRLKPKLAMSAVFLSLLPLLLVMLLGLLILFSALGASRTTGARRVLRDWAQLATQDEAAGRRLFPIWFRAGPSGGEGAVPAWLSDLTAAVHTAKLAPGRGASKDAASGAERDGDRPGGAGPHVDSKRSERGLVIQVGETEPGGVRQWAPVDTTAFLANGQDLWVVGLRGIGRPDWRVDGFRVDEEVLAHLAALVGADVVIWGTTTVRRGGVVATAIEEERDSSPADSAASHRRISLRARHNPAAAPDSLLSFWQRPLGFGVAILGVLVLESPTGDDRVTELPVLAGGAPAAARLRQDSLLLHLNVSPASLVQEFISRDNELSLAVVIALGVLALMFLILEVFAVFLGVRIVGGITSAVRTLHQGTLRLARGDLDARIEVPNEDEFGDLANSFNEMTVAVKRGREEAIAREWLERELQTAREIQERLLPHEMPRLPGFEICGTSLPSRQVGGDYFDFLDLGPGRLGIAIGDVSGKGIPAALLMANLQACLQGQVIHPSDVAEIVTRVNELLVRSTDPSRFASFFYGVLDRGTGAFTFTNAGHNPPILLRASGGVHYLEAGGLLLGLLPGQRYAQEAVTLAPGDVIVLYTDGITEAVGPTARAALLPSPAVASPAGGNGSGHGDGDAAGRHAGGTESALDSAEVAAVAEDADDEFVEGTANMYGEQRLLATLQACAGLSALEIQKAILDSVARHTAGVPQSDDITLVVIKCRELERAG